MNANSGGFAGIEIDVPSFDFDSVFHSEYRRIVRVIARVVRDPARAEELAAEVLWKLSKTPKAQGENYGGWVSLKTCTTPRSSIAMTLSP